MIISNLSPKSNFELDERGPSKDHRGIWHLMLTSRDTTLTTCLQIDLSQICVQCRSACWHPSACVPNADAMLEPLCEATANEGFVVQVIHVCHAMRLFVYLDARHGGAILNAHSALRTLQASREARRADLGHCGSHIHAIHEIT